jgi:hypothetical protein
MPVALYGRVISAACFRRQLLRVFSIAFLALLACSATLSAQTLMWNANTEADLAGYIVQYGTQSGSPSTSIDVGNTTSRAFTGLTAGSTYYFRVVAYNSGGQQSTPSSEVSYAVPSVPVNPTITSVSPTSGPSTGGTVITINGTNFAAGATVRVGGVLASGVTLVSATQLRATTPAGTAGAQSVQVTNTTGASATSTGAFTYTAVAPTLTSVSPTSGPTAGGTTITLTGSSFVSGATVRVGGTAATNVTFVSATQLTARTPAGTAGARDVQVTNPNGQSATRTGGFTYTAVAAPTLTAVSPTSGPTAGGTTITLTGSNFVSGATVRVGGTSATNVMFVSTTQLTARTPAGTAGARDVQVTNPDGQSATRTGAFSYTGSTATPTLTWVTPASGPAAGGTTITMYGTNFVSGLTVRVGGAAATNVVYVSSQELTARTPAGTAGVRDVQVINPDGQVATRTGAFTYTGTTAAPTLTAVSPTSGPTAGGTTITLAGTGFVSGATVRVGGTAATNVAFVSATQLTARTPAGTAGARDVQITNPDGQSATRTGGFTYNATTSAPTLTSISPDSGSTGGNTFITLTGTNFVSGATVRIGGVAATSVAFVSATQLTARTPAGTLGVRDVQITNPDGQSVTRIGAFTYDPPNTPRITSITPASGPVAGGTLITVSGANFTSSGMTLRIGGVAATNVVSTNNTTLTAVTPAGTAGARDVFVGNSWGNSKTYAGAFTYTSSQTSSQTATFTRYLAEGVETDQMSTQLALANPGTTDTQATLTFETTSGEQTQVAVDVPARSRRTLDLSTVPELAGQSFSTQLESDQPLALDRLVSLNADGASASLETAVDQPSTTWHFAEGSTVDPMELFYLVQNPGRTPARVEVRYLLPDGGAPVVRTYTVEAGSRATIWVDREDPALAATDVAATITSLDGAPIVVERSLYLREAGSTAPRGGDTSTGVTAPSTRWFVEGETGRYTTRLLLANPGSTPADVRATYQRADGRRVNRSYTLAPTSRQTIDVASVHPSLSNTTVGVTVEASAPIVVERTKWWGANGTLDEAISGSGSTAGAARWLLAEAELGGERQATTTVTLFNQGAATDVAVTLLFEDGAEVSATFPVAAGARFDVPLAEAFPAAADRRFSVLVEGADASANLVVDRAIFWQAAGATRTAGADGAATRLK